MKHKSDAINRNVLASFNNMFKDNSNLEFYNSCIHPSSNFMKLLIKIFPAKKIEIMSIGYSFYVKKIFKKYYICG